jgi:hypothetical protein
MSSQIQVCIVAFQVALQTDIKEVLRVETSEITTGIDEKD